MEKNLTVKSKPRPITIVKIVVDVLMTAVFILLMDTNVTGMVFHEIAGLAIGGVFFLHMLMNWNWIKNVSRNLFGKQVTMQTRIRYIVDVLLFVGVTMIIISGALMSVYVFPGADGGGTWKAIHTTFSYGCIPLIGFHTGLHVKWIKNAFSKMLKVTSESNVRKWALRTASMAMAVWGIISAVGSGFFGKMLSTDTQDQIASDPVYVVSEDTQAAIKSSNSASDGSSDNATESVQQDTQTTVSVEDFLSGLTCTACHKRCSLLSPKCGRGRQQQQEAIAQYESQYSAAQASASVYTQNGSNYLQIGTAVYTLTESTNNTALTKQSAQTSNNTAGSANASETISVEEDTNLVLANGADSQDSQDVWNTVLTFAPIMWLFGVIGWAVSRLTGRKQKNKNTPV